MYCLWLSNPRHPSQSPLCVVPLQTLHNVPGYLPTRLSNQFLRTQVSKKLSNKLLLQQRTHPPVYTRTFITRYWRQVSAKTEDSCCMSKTCLGYLKLVIIPWPYLLVLSLVFSSSRLSSTITLSFLYPFCNFPWSVCC